MATLNLKRKPAPYEAARTIADIAMIDPDHRQRVGFSGGCYSKQTYSTREQREPVAPRRERERFKMKPKRKGKR